MTDTIVERLLTTAAAWSSRGRRDTTLVTDGPALLRDPTPRT